MKMTLNRILAESQRQARGRVTSYLMQRTLRTTGSESANYSAALDLLDAAGQHPHVGVGYCSECGHYGEDCTGR